MATLLLDLKYALRSLARSPGLALLAILSLSLGIGLNSAIFTILNSLLLRPLPVREPSRLVRVYPGPVRDSFPVPVFRDLARNQAAAQLAVSSLKPLSWTQGEQSRRVVGSIVSGSYFPVLGVRPALGRTLGPGDDQVPGGHPVAVVSHAFWAGALMGDPAVLGRALTLNGQAYTVVGVCEPAFHGDAAGLVPEVWVPLAMAAQAFPGAKTDLLEARTTSWVQMFGRLNPGVGRTQAEQALQSLERGAYGESWDKGRGPIRVAAMSSLPRNLQTTLAAALAALQAVVLVVLLIACSNIANLQLAKGVARRQEVAVRLALGASRSRLARQFLTESALLSLLGAAGGLALGALAMRAVPSLIPPVGGPDLVFDLGMDGRVVAFAVALALGTGLVFGLAPALQASKAGMTGVLKEEAAGLTIRTGLTRRLFVVGQVAMSLVLLVLSALFLRSLGQASAIDPGFERSRMVLFNVDPGTLGYDGERGGVLLEAIRQRAAALPGVRGVALAWLAPLGGGRGSASYEVRGQERAKDAPERSAGYNRVSAGFFATLGIPVLTGREFNEADRAGSPRTAVVNAAFARQVLGGQALGRELVVDRHPVTVVGVAKDVMTGSLGEAPEPAVYVPLAQDPVASLTVLVATAGEPAPLLAAMRGVVRGVEPHLPVNDLRTMADHLRLALFPARIGALLLGLSGLLALILATTGVYGVMAFDASQRGREIGIRMALGARLGDVVRMMVGQGMREVGAGLGLGLAAAWALSRLLANLLYGIAAADPVAFLAIPALLAGVALVACFIPAHRAGRLDPVTALRKV